MTIRADDNWLQRRYFTWAEQHYRRMPPRLRAEVERIDRWLYSRRAAVVWLGLFFAVVGSSMVLGNAGLPPPVAVVSSLVVWVGVLLVVVGAWLRPERFAGRRVVRKSVFITLGLYLGLVIAFLVGRVISRGGFDLATLRADVRSTTADVAPLLAVATIVVGAVIELTAFARRRVLKADLELATLVGERDAAARQAAEAQLRLLQGQIRPHFIFNTLASLQHWVDTGDARAGPLLRSLTALLRNTTEAMAAPSPPRAPNARRRATTSRSCGRGSASGLSIASTLLPTARASRCRPVSSSRWSKTRSSTASNRSSAAAASR